MVGKELQFAQDEDKKNQDRMSELAGKLQQKIKTYKQQIEEAEEIAALNLAKFRRAQQELEETEDRAKMADANLSVVRMMVSTINMIEISKCFNILLFSVIKDLKHKEAHPLYITFPRPKPLPRNTRIKEHTRPNLLLPSNMNDENGQDDCFSCHQLTVISF